MSSIQEQVLAAYEELDWLARRQLAIVSLARTDESLASLEELNIRFSIKQESIDSLLAGVEGYKGFSEPEVRSMMGCISSIQLAQQGLEERLNEWYSDDAETMRRVRVGQTTVRSYGGLNYNDAISYYIDEKK
ncbi:hypothetical protein [Paenibacillus sp. PAMC21692]|uniref:hypothetical protein n=1 Tax=Paenibacillus sp. PAMC21692 TaxID=2762320 RepID=UPI00164E37DD|nr:hypothetical protein [Paenibacillus sp. PAMC21692]QNK58362.1 hypothetical protein H7F31_05365 [Paenibacillus sp. PAMC21692]